MLLQTTTQLVYANGERADIDTGIYNHHVVTSDVNKQSSRIAGCPNKDTTTTSSRATRIGSLIVGQGEDASTELFTTKDGKFDSGFYIGASDRIFQFSEIVNYSNVTRSVFVETELEFVPGKPKGWMDASISAFNVNACDSSMPREGAIIVAVPKDSRKWNMVSKDQTVNRDGYILAARKLSISLY